MSDEGISSKSLFSDGHFLDDSLVNIHTWTQLVLNSHNAKPDLDGCYSTVPHIITSNTILRKILHNYNETVYFYKIHIQLNAYRYIKDWFYTCTHVHAHTHTQMAEACMFHWHIIIAFGQASFTPTQLLIRQIHQTLSRMRGVGKKGKREKYNE